MPDSVQDTASADGDERVEVHVVLSVHVEPGYPGDALSAPVERVQLTAHSSREAAMSRLVCELDHDIAEDGASCMRRSWSTSVRVPRAAFAGMHPLRWLGDRHAMLLRACGAEPDAFARAHAGGALRELSGADLARALAELPDAMARGGEDAMLAAMRCAASASRAAHSRAAGPELAAGVHSLTRAIVSASFSGGDVSVFAPSVQALARSFSFPAEPPTAP